MIRNRFDYGIGGEPTLPEIPISPELDYVPNPAFVSRETLALINPHHLLTAQEVYNMYHAGMALSGPNSPVTLYNRLGLNDMTSGVITLRKLAGEKIYQGITPIHMSARKRTDLQDYLLVASQGGLAFDDWATEGHDAKYHLFGALTTSGDITKVVRTSARSSLRMPRRKQETIGQTFDNLTYAILDLGIHVHISPTNKIERIAEDLMFLRAETGVNHFTEEDALFFAYNQYLLLKSLREIPLFVDPAEAAAISSSSQTQWEFEQAA